MAPTVLMLGWGFPPHISGGLDTAVYELFEQFEDRDDVTLELMLPGEYAPQDREHVHGVPTGEGDIRTRIDRLTDEFVEMAGDADIVHTHDWFGYNPGVEAQAAHDDLEWVSTYHSLSSDRNLDPPRIEVQAEQAIADEADHLISVSEFTRGEVQDLYGADSTVIYNGFPKSETTGRDFKEELGIDGEMLFFVGRHTHQKGLSHLVYSIERLSRADVTLVVGGTGHLTDQLERFVELLEIEDSVEFVGYVPEGELADYYASADLFVSPSLAEPFGITIVEALSVGTRVVTTNCGAAEILPDDCLVQVEPDSRSIAKGIQRGLAMNEPVEYEERTWDTVADEHAEFYHDVVSGDAT